MKRIHLFFMYITFPGVMLHEFAHKKYCDWSGTPVFEVRYLRWGNPMGYVVHAPPATLSASFAIAIGPLILNTAWCGLLTFGSWYFSVWSWPWVLLWWIGLSAGMHALPSTQDGKSFVETVVASKGRMSLFFLVSWIVALLIRLANALKIFWFDVWYAVAISSLLPLYFGFVRIPDAVLSLVAYFKSLY